MRKSFNQTQQLNRQWRNAKPLKLNDSKFNTLEATSDNGNLRGGPKSLPRNNGNIHINFNDIYINYQIQ